MKSRKKGIIVSWFDNKGFGFIRPEAGNDEHFVHISDFVTFEARPAVGQIVSYIPLKKGSKRMHAELVRQADIATSLAI